MTRDTYEERIKNLEREHAKLKAEVADLRAKLAEVASRLDAYGVPRFN